LTRWTAESVDRLVADLAWGRSLATLDDQDRWRVRQVAMEALGRISDLDQPLPDWIRLARAALGEALSALVDSPRHSPSDRLKTAKSHQGVRAAERFIAAAPKRLAARTVHDVKGLLLAAVLLVLDRARSSRREAQTSLFSRCLDTSPGDDSEAEELRIAYVALTRAERYCALGVPSNCMADEVERFRALGFHTV
jgi:superfamily I DNA/RNA helicase